MVVKEEEWDSWAGRRRASRSTEMVGYIIGCKVISI